MTGFSSIAIVTILSAGLSGSALGQERVDSSYHLTGNGVTRRPPTPAFADREYFLIRGVRMDARCHYSEPPWGPYWAERLVESDDSRCLQIRSLGVYLETPTLPPKSHMMISTFAVRFDSTRARLDTTHRDSVRRKP